MRRLFWAALGASAGVLVVRKVTRTAEAYTPQGLARGISGLGEAIRDFADQVGAGMAEREIELRDALGFDGEHDLPPGAAAQVTEHPTAEHPTAEHPTAEHPTRDWKGER